MEKLTDILRMVVALLLLGGFPEAMWQILNFRKTMQNIKKARRNATQNMWTESDFINPLRW
jgi:hypothetical protein